MNRVALVTGASQGIGAAVAYRLGRDGWAVLVNYCTDRDAAERVVAQVTDEGGRAVAARGDVSRASDLSALFAFAESALGPVSAVVNNAGILPEAGMLTDISEEALRRCVEVNVIGTLLGCRAAVSHMRARDIAGGIVNVSSVAASTGSPGEYVYYAATKAAVNALTIGLAKEVGPLGIRVNAVAPALIDTRIHATAGQPDRLDRLRAAIPLRRPGRPDEVADAVAWLLSDAAAFVSGAILPVAGGL